jgi:hypothetical protein
VNEFDGNGSAEHGLLSAIDASHAACGDSLQDQISAGECLIDERILIDAVSVAGARSALRAEAMRGIAEVVASRAQWHLLGNCRPFVRWSFPSRRLEPENRQQLAMNFEF